MLFFREEPQIGGDWLEVSSLFPFVRVWVAIHNFFFGCFVFVFLFRFVFWLLSCLWCLRVVHGESVTPMFAELCCAWRNL